MFFTYLLRELRRRAKQAVVIASGLAIGIALVVIVSATAAGVQDAQGQVLHSLYGVGTDMTVTKNASAGSGGPFRFFVNGQRSSGTRPAAGTHFSRDTLTPILGETTIPTSDVAKVAAMHGVSVATGGLTLTDSSISGTIPNFSSFSQQGSGFGSAPGTFKSPFTTNSFSVDGVQITKSQVGPLTASDITSGSYFSSTENTADVAILSSSYATQIKKTVGSTITVAGTSVKVVGLADVPSGSADVYLPLGTAQSLAKLKNEVTTIYISAASASDVNSIAAAVSSALPKTTVTTSASLASEVTGSLHSAATLVSKLGKWLSLAALLVAFLIAGLLMMAAVARRVREFGTLKAIGWRTRRVVGQVMGEGVTLGLLGGLAGLLLGLGGSAIVSAIAPSLTATIGSTFSTGGGFNFGGGAFSGGSFPTGGSFPRPAGFRPTAAGAARNVPVHLTAPFQGDTMLIALGLALAGGLIAGAFGAWRAARLRPAAALRRIE